MKFAKEPDRNNSRLYESKEMHNSYLKSMQICPRFMKKGEKTNGQQKSKNLKIRKTTLTQKELKRRAKFVNRTLPSKNTAENLQWRNERRWEGVDLIGALNINRKARESRSTKLPFCWTVEEPTNLQSETNTSWV